MTSRMCGGSSLALVAMKVGPFLCLAVMTAVVDARATTSATRFREDNDLRIYREDPAQFNSSWPRAQKLDGSPRAPLEYLDVQLYSNAGFNSFWDVLHPIEWERTWAAKNKMELCRQLWWVSYAASIVYLIGLRFGLVTMENRQPYDLKWPLTIWNGLLAAFSIIGVVRLVPHLFLMLTTYGFEYTVCRSLRASYGAGPPGLWLWLFLWSKFFELFDTAFLVLRKKQVGFLHWYHHCTVLLYCWHATMWEMPTSIYFAAMNYSVHAVMYSYYFLAAVTRKPPRWGLLVTILQLVQMAFGIAITSYHSYVLVYQTTPHCDGYLPNLIVAAGMYASYFMLFLEFFVKRYCGPGRNKSDKKAKLKPSAQKLD